MRRQTRGFSMIGVLITVAIIGILFVMQLKTMQTSTAVMKPGGGSSSVVAPSAGNATTINSLRQIHMMQMAYHQRFNRYATFEELLADGSIPAGYAAREDDATGVAFIRYYDLEFSASEESYIILAFPNSEAATAFPDTTLPAYRIDETGQVKEEDGYDDRADTEAPTEDTTGDFGGLFDTPEPAPEEAPPAEGAE